MPSYVAFLRAINVGGRFLKMATLAAHFHALGYEGATTFINSGNVIFTSNARSATKLAAKIESELEPLLGFKSEAFVRSVAEVQSIASKGAIFIESVPAGDVNVAFLANPLSSVQREAVSSLQNKMDSFECLEREIFWISQSKQSESKFSNVVFERKLGVRTTFRRATMLARLAQQLT